MNRKEFFLLMLVLLANLLQAAFTELSDDEAYYWMYAQHPAFGYFDHPPMVAWMINAGTFITDSPLGLRLFGVLSVTAALYLLWMAVDVKLRKGFFPLFLIAALSVPLLHLFGFIMTPDAPLLFFSAAFILVWKYFLQHKTIKLGLLTGVVMAGLMYSKYHGILLIAFSVLANPRVLLSPQLWSGFLCAAILYLPHLWWQYSHDFPSVYYHMYWRASKFEAELVIKYITELALIHGPVLFVMVLWFLWNKRKSAIKKDAFVRTLVFCWAGILVFFFMASFRSRVEAHWILLSALPALLLLFYALEEVRERGVKVLRIAFVASAGLLLGVRFFLLANVLPVRTEYHGTVQEVKEIAKAAANTPLVFLNAYKWPAKTAFYTRHPVIAINEINYRMNQYDLWMVDTMFHLKSVAVAEQRNRNHFATDSFINTAYGDKWFLHRIDTFETYQKIQIKLPKVQGAVKAGGVLRLSVQLHNPYPYTVRFNHAQLPVKLEAFFLHFRTIKAVTAVNASNLPIALNAGETLNCVLEIQLPKEKETYNVGVGITAGIIGPMFNSNMTLVTTN